MERKELKLLRKLNKLTLEDVGKKLGVSKATAQRYESGEIDIPYERIFQLAEIFNVEPGDLFPDSSSKKQVTDKETEVEKALELYRLYRNANPQIQNAVEVLLKPSQSDP